MSEELAAVVVSKMGPAELDELLCDALQVLRERYADAQLHEVSVTFEWCERRDLGRPQVERSMSWKVQVDNERGYGKTRLEALSELRENIEATARVPTVARRVADVLREIADDHWARDRAIRGAQEILDQERRNRR